MGLCMKICENFEIRQKKCVKCMRGWGFQPNLIQQLFEEKSVIFQKVRWISVSAFIWDHLWVIWTWDGQVGAQKYVWLDSSPPHTLNHRKSPYRLGLSKSRFWNIGLSYILIPHEIQNHAVLHWKALRNGKFDSNRWS